MSLSNRKLKIGNNEYPLFSEFDDIKDSHDKILKVEIDGKIYYARLLSNNISLNVSSNGNFPNMDFVERSIPADGHLQIDNQYKLSSSDNTWKYAECQKTTTIRYAFCEHDFWARYVYYHSGSKSGCNDCKSEEWVQNSRYSNQCYVIKKYDCNCFCKWAYCGGYQDCSQTRTGDFQTFYGNCWTYYEGETTSGNRPIIRYDYSDTGTK